MDVILGPLFFVFAKIIDIYTWVIIIWVIMSWLITFNVINTYNNFVSKFFSALASMVEPALAPIRRFMPNLGGLDISPIILIFALIFLQNVFLRLSYKFGGMGL